MIRVAPVDADYLKTIGIAPTSGTDFTTGSVDTTSGWQVIINESALDFFGWTREDALGKELDLWQATGVVKGVVNDFHFSSLHSPIAPLLIFTGNGLALNNLLVRFDSEKAGQQTELLKKIWAEVNPDSPFVLTRLNERY